MSDQIKFPICDRCKKEIQDNAYVIITPTIVLQKYFAQTPTIFKCTEHAENFAKGMGLHSDCWMDTLREHGIPLHDMTKIIELYKKKLESTEIK